MVRIDTGGPERIDWPSRDEWARQRRTLYGDQINDVVSVSRRAEDHASPEEVKAALDEAKELWTEMGRFLKSLGPAISDAEWRRRWREALATDPEERRALEEGPVGKRIFTRDDRLLLNRRIIKPLSKGELPLEQFFGFSSVDKDTLPLLTELQTRYWSARKEAIADKEREYAERPIDDEAWAEELRHRASVEAWRRRLQAIA